MIKRFIYSFAILLLFSPSAFAKRPCAANDTDQEAIRVRALQTELMVAAIACSKEPSYNAFMRKFGNELADSHQTLSRFFYKQYEASGETHLNSFITSLANQASEQSLDQDEAQYCDSTNTLFSKVMQQDPKELASFARKNTILKDATNVAGTCD